MSSSRMVRVSSDLWDALVARAAGEGVSPAAAANAAIRASLGDAVSAAAQAKAPRAARVTAPAAPDALAGFEARLAAVEARVSALESRPAVAPPAPRPAPPPAATPAPARVVAEDEWGAAPPVQVSDSVPSPSAPRVAAAGSEKPCPCGREGAVYKQVSRLHVLTCAMYGNPVKGVVRKEPSTPPGFRPPPAKPAEPGDQVPKETPPAEGITGKPAEFDAAAAPARLEAAKAAIPGVVVADEAPVRTCPACGSGVSKARSRLHAPTCVWYGEAPGDDAPGKTNEEQP